jgi:hypothetical protein
MREDARRWETDTGTEAVERSAVMTVLNVAGPGNRAPPPAVHRCIGVGSRIALASLASRFIIGPRTETGGKEDAIAFY